MNGDPKPSPPTDDFSTMTSSALLEQLVYIDNFMNNPSSATENLTPNMDIDGQLSMDLAAFADDSFIFPDEEKKHNDPLGGDDHHDHFNPLNHGPFDNDVFASPENHMDILNGSGPHAVNLKVHDDSKINHDNDTNNGHLAHINHENDNSHRNTADGALSSLDYLIPDLNKLPKFPVPPGAKNSLVQVGLTTNQIELLSALIAQHQSALKLKPKSLQLQLQQQLEPLHLQQSQQQQVRQHNQIPGLDLSLDYLNTASSAATISNPTTTPSLTNTPPNASSVSSFSSANSTRQLQINNGTTLPSQKLRTSSTAASTTSTIRPSLASILHSSTTIPLSYHRKQLSTASVSLLESLPLSERLSSVTTGAEGSAELDKRRRNTAALARFRVKKKMKERQMENKITQLSELIDNLENKIQHLETENKVLRTLIIEKGEQRNDDELKLLRERATK